MIKILIRLKSKLLINKPFLLFLLIIYFNIIIISLKVALSINKRWYDFHNHKEILFDKTMQINNNEFVFNTINNYFFIPTFVMGGNILVMRNRIKRTMGAKHDVNYFDLVIFPGFNNESSGFIYLDDGENYSYLNKEFLLGKFDFNNYVLKFKLLNLKGYTTPSIIENITLLGVEKKINFKEINYSTTNKEAICNEISSNSRTIYDLNDNKLVIKNAKLKLYCECSLQLISNSN